MKRIGSLGVAVVLALAAPRVGGYSLCGGFLQPSTHPFHVDPTLPMNGAGTVQDWVGAVILASQEWGTDGVANFRFVFAGLVAPPYPPGTSVVTLGVPGCPGFCPPAATTSFSTCIDPAGPWDVSGNPPPGTLDLQGFATHQLGHVVGLAHSTVAGATMSPALGNLLEWRSIEADDISGVLAIYGAAPANAAVLDSTGLPYTGGSVLVRLLGPAGPAVVGFDTSPGPTVVPGLGSVALGFSPAFVPVAVAAPGTIPISIPANPALIGATVHMQALVSAAAGPALSNPSRIAIPY